jgi:hypothetical protein
VQLRLLGLNDFHGYLKVDGATTLQRLHTSAPGSSLMVAAEENLHPPARGRPSGQA